LCRYCSSALAKVDTAASSDIRNQPKYPVDCGNEDLVPHILHVLYSDCRIEVSDSAWDRSHDGPEGEREDDHHRYYAQPAVLIFQDWLVPQQNPLFKNLKDKIFE
jgi:hypothetical protein